MNLSISRLVHDYADAVCNTDAEAWEATWAPESVWDMGAVRFEGRADILDAWVQAMSGFEQVVQVVYNGSADLDSDAGTGRGRWYIAEYLKPRSNSAKMMLGFYDDRYVYVDGAWLFGERRLTRLYSGPPDLTGDFAGPPAPSVDP